MIGELFSWLGSLMSASFGLALLASFCWGIVSVLFSPCHLTSIPLVIGYISRDERISSRRSLWMAFLFAMGMLLSIALIGLATAVLGRLLGDVGLWGNILVALIFLIMGLYLLELIPLSWNGLPLHQGHHGAWGALMLGLIFGIGLGPCTFAFLAPVLGIVFQLAQQEWLKPLLLVLAFGIGHAAVITLAGGLGARLQNYLAWSAASPAAGRVRKAAGILVLLGGIYFVYTVFFRG